MNKENNKSDGLILDKKHLFIKLCAIKPFFIGCVVNDGKLKSAICIVEVDL